VRSELILGAAFKNLSNFLPINQERVGDVIQDIWPGLSGMVVYLDWDSALLPIGGLDLDAKHLAVAARLAAITSEPRYPG
jgi:hypothetical protein